MENRTTAPALKRPSTRASPANTTAVTSAYTGSRALQEIIGRVSMVISRSRRLSMVRVAITAGIAQAKPDSIGTNALPCSPTRPISRSMTNATRAR